LKEIDLIAIVLQAVSEFNDQLEEKSRIPLSSDTPLFGQGGTLDSLSLVTLILIVEEKVFDKLGVTITIADDKALSQKRSPFSNVSSLAEYVNRLIQEKQNG
jgi:acyl carrier protein